MLNRQYVTSKKECSGCGACKNICPQKCIQLVSDDEGFEYAVIDEKSCTNCNKCHLFCNEKRTSQDDNNICDCYAVVNHSDYVRRNSSSGGCFYEIANYFINSLNGIVYGVILDESFLAKTVRAARIEEVIPMMGSKYIQSSVGDTYEQVMIDLSAGYDVVYSGTPCQLSGLNAFLKEKRINTSKLLLVSIICHGVSSPMVWDRYLKDENFNNLQQVRFRDKSVGWRERYIYKQYIDKSLFISANEDPYFVSFLKNLSLRPSCFECKSKGINQHADIVLGDFWGYEKVFNKDDDNLGISAVIIKSDKGRSVLNNISNQLKMEQAEYNDILKYNECLEQSVKYNGKRDLFFNLIKAGSSVEDAIYLCTDNKSSSIERREYISLMYKKYAEALVKGKTASNCLVNQKRKKIALYSICDFFDIFLYDFCNNPDIEVQYISDKNYKKYRDDEFCGAKVISPSELVGLYKKGEVDSIVICNVLLSNQIMHELIALGISRKDIFLPVSLVYEMEMCE